MAVLTKTTTAAIIAIAIASSLLFATGIVGSVFAAKKGTDGETNTIIDPDKSGSPSTRLVNGDQASPTTGDSSSISKKDLKDLSKCQSGAAEDGDLTSAETQDCYNQVVGQGQGQQDESSPAQGNDQSQNGQGENQIRSSFLGGQTSNLIPGGLLPGASRP
jgi:hypothetical protein